MLTADGDLKQYKPPWVHSSLHLLNVPTSFKVKKKPLLQSACQSPNPNTTGFAPLTRATRAEARFLVWGVDIFFGQNHILVSNAYSKFYFGA